MLSRVISSKTTPREKGIYTDTFQTQIVVSYDTALYICYRNIDSILSCRFGLQGVFMYKIVTLRPDP
jgi:hypothetical protein